MKGYVLPDRIEDFANRNSYAVLGIFPAELNPTVLEERKKEVLELVEGKSWEWKNFAHVSYNRLSGKDFPYLNGSLIEGHGGSIVVFPSLDEMAAFMDIPAENARHAFKHFATFRSVYICTVANHGLSILGDMHTRKALQREPFAEIEEKILQEYPSALFGIYDLTNKIEELREPPDPERQISLPIPVIHLPGSAGRALKVIQNTKFDRDSSGEWPSDFRYTADLKVELYK